MIVRGPPASFSVIEGSEYEFWRRGAKTFLTEELVYHATLLKFNFYTQIVLVTLNQLCKISPQYLIYISVSNNIIVLSSSFKYWPKSCVGLSFVHTCRFKMTCGHMMFQQQGQTITSGITGTTGGKVMYFSTPLPQEWTLFRYLR